MSLSKPVWKYSPFSLQDITLFSIAGSLVQKSIQFKPKPESYVRDETSIRNSLANIHPIYANDLTRMIIEILKNIDRLDCLPLLSHSFCESVAISSDGKSVDPVISGQIGSLTRLKILKVDTVGSFANYPTNKLRKKKAGYRPLPTLDIALRSLTYLTVIKLPNVCTSEILNSIGSKCRLLVYLDIKESKISPLTEIRSLAKCEKLKFLNLDSVGGPEELTPHVAYLLQNLPDLRSLADFDIRNVLNFIARNSSFTKKFPGAYKLETAFLSAGNDTNTVDDFAKYYFCMLFQNLHELNSEVGFGSDVTFLRHFPKMTSLRLTNERVEDLLHLFSESKGKYRHFVLDGGTQYVNVLFDLCDFRYLSILELSFCNGVNLELINRSSPFLESFTLENCISADTDFIEETEGFTKLTTLKISDTNLTESEIRFVLEHCDGLTELCLSSVDIFIREKNTDYHLDHELFYEIVNAEKKQNLTSVKLNIVGPTCHSVKYLIDNFQKLTYVEIIDLERESDTIDQAVRKSIASSLQRDTTRSITLKMWDIPITVTRRAIENDPSALKSLQHSTVKSKYTKSKVKYSKLL